MFESPKKYKCADGRTVQIVSPIIEVRGMKMCVVEFTSYPDIAIIDDDGKNATIYASYFDWKKMEAAYEEVKMTDEEVKECENDVSS